jgi:hypothetical protein
MENLAITANIAEIVGATIVVIGLFFAVLQMRQIREQRRELAAIELFRFYGNPSFTRAVNRMLHMPDGMTVEEIRREGNGFDEAAMLISSTMENIGVMTHQRIVPFTVVNHLIGASTIILWKKLEPWTAKFREETDNVYLFEWFQWLFVQLDQYDEGDQRPAYEAYRTWIPQHLLRRK